MALELIFDEDEGLYKVGKRRKYIPGMGLRGQLRLGFVNEGPALNYQWDVHGPATKLANATVSSITRTNNNQDPKNVGTFLCRKKVHSYSCCVIQVCTFLSFGIAECYILSVMAYDRYVAIRDPLRYSVTMNWGICRRLAAGSWLGGFLASTVDTVTTFQLSFCQDNVINHFLCEMPALLHLSCTDTTHAELVMQVLCIFTLLCPITFIILSYAHIIIAVLRIRSAPGRRKTFSTCSSHLLVVTLFFGTVMSLYLKPKSLSSPEYNKIVSVFYVAFTPTLNPLIYSLRNKEVKMALRKLLGKPEGA
uniref:Olfactory receptor n=1 Tax=Phascolarctos cinereus TaxID=38626 RepID=A0A6P5IPN8_PHACI|nr:olfactory receptor 1019-like [Phascolarctos cinereus]